MLIYYEDTSDYAQASGAFVELWETTDIPATLDFTGYNSLVALQNCFYDNVIPDMTALTNDYYSTSVFRCC